jgi:hypothetical protein
MVDGSPMAEPGERGSGSRRHWRVLVAGSFALFALVAFAAWGAIGNHRARADRPARPVHSAAAGETARKTVVRLGPQHHRPRPQSRTIHVASGATVRRFDVSEPAGAIQLLRVAVPHGTRARITGTIPQVAGVSISTPRQRSDPSESCRRRGGINVCTQSEEACPMPPATWHFRLRKLSGRAGVIRLEFLVG